MCNKKDYPYSMIHYYYLKRKMLTLLTAIVLLTVLLPLRSESDNLNKITLAVFPFNDINQNSLDLNVSARLSAELSKQGNIKVVPLKMVTERLYEIEPSYMWTERERRSREGGIIWSITPTTIVQFRQNVDVDYTVHGDIWRYENSWKIDSVITVSDDISFTKSFSVSGESGDLKEKLREMAERIEGWILRETTVKDAEEDVRSYLGGMYSLDFVIEEMQKRLRSFPDSIQVRALLLDLLRIEKRKYQDQIVTEGRKVIHLIDPSKESEIRYLLSLSLDPFDLVAGIFEMRHEWMNAIEIRRSALKLFPVRAAMHERELGKNYYRYAMVLEEDGKSSDAVKNYRLALRYLEPSSEFYKKSGQGVQRLKN
jgi:hypothetical protein